MKQLTHFIVLFAIALMLTACGESTTDESLPEGTTPTDAPAERKVEPSVEPQPTTEQPALEPEVTTPPVVEDTPEYPPLPTPTAGENDAERLKAPGISYVLPEGWTVGPAKQMRLLTLLPPDGNGADLAISRWPGDVGGFPLNVNRWAGQVGLPPIPGLMTAAASDFEQFKIDGNDATWIPLMNEETNIAILAVWVPIGDEPENPDQTWIFKLTCKADQVTALAPAMRAWCESIQFED